MDKCSICQQDNWQTIIKYDVKPEQETDYKFLPYERELLKCGFCGHFENRYGAGIQLNKLYEGGYWSATYQEKVKETFTKIMSLPDERSDNRGRVKYIEENWSKYCPDISKEVLDIGSGLAVFPAVMREKGWAVTALDPDPYAAKHAQDVAKVTAISADYLKEEVAGQFNLITLNKVLEHVPDMISFLKKLKNNLSSNGFVYLEIPDGEMAIHDVQGPNREEFFVEHYCAFSALSFIMLAKNAGLSVKTVERLIEPSGKYTLRGFFYYS